MISQLVKRGISLLMLMLIVFCSSLNTVHVHLTMDLEGIVKHPATCLGRQATAAGRLAGACQMTMRPLSDCTL
jgi:hypothetical protein